MTFAIQHRFPAALLLSACLIATTGCVGNPLPEAGSADEKLYREKCTVCHSWPHPQRHTALEWDHYLDVMEGHMKKKNIAFPDNEKEIIRQYLHRNAR